MQCCPWLCWRNVTRRPRRPRRLGLLRTHGTQSTLNSRSSSVLRVANKALRPKDGNSALTLGRYLFRRGSFVPCRLTIKNVLATQAHKNSAYNQGILATNASQDLSFPHQRSGGRNPTSFPRILSHRYVQRGARGEGYCASPRGPATFCIAPVVILRYFAVTFPHPRRHVR